MGSKTFYVLRSTFYALLLLSACAGKEPEVKPPPPEVPSPPQTSWNEPIKIGLLLPLTGPYGRFGEAVLNGITCAIGLFDPCPAPSHQIQIIVKDTEGSSEKTITAFTELTENEKVSAVIGPLLSQEMDGVLSLAETKNIPLITLAPKKKNTVVSGFVFQHALFPEREVLEIAKRAAQQELRAFILFYPQNRYGEQYAQLFKETLNKIDSGKVVAEKAYPPDAPDFTEFVGQLFRTPALQKYLEKDKIDKLGLFIPESFRQIIKIAEALDPLSLPGLRLVGTSRWHHPKLLLHPFASLEGAILSTPFYPEAKRPQTQKFNDNFSAAHNAPPSWLEALGYDATALFLEAIRSRGNGYPPDIRDALKGIHDFPAVVGSLSLNGEGISEWPLEFLTVREGKFIPLSQE